MDYKLEDLADGKPIGFAEFIRPELYKGNAKKPVKKPVDPVMYCDPATQHPDAGREFAYIHTPQAEYEAFKRYEESQKQEPKYEIIISNDD